MIIEIHASKVREVWPVVKEGLEAVLKRFKHRWIPEDVFTALVTGQAFLYMIADHGFIIAKNYLDADGLALFIWVIYAKPGTLKAHREEILLDLDVLARRIGAKRIRHYSSRRGWGRDMFEQKQYIYEREV
jgi:hypothetical protein